MDIIMGIPLVWSAILLLVYIWGLLQKLFDWLWLPDSPRFREKGVGKDRLW